MTREEIIEKHNFKGFVENLHPILDEWAKIQSISFAEWTADEYITSIKDYHTGKVTWRKFNGNSNEYEFENVTTEDLYNIYLESVK